MAGDGSRFNYKFKPFLYANEKQFIELAKEPFDTYLIDFDINYIFIFREDHNNEYNVASKLLKLFPNNRVQCCILKEKTQGPLETLQMGISQLDIRGPSFICDCDHSINIEPMVKIIKNNTEADIIIPVWNISESEYKKWGKIIINKNYSIMNFCEKEFVQFSPDYSVKGLIGCYYLKDITVLLRSDLKENLSDFLKETLNKLNYTVAFILEAYFFGDIPSLQKFRADRAKKQTIFIDLDGTIVKQADNFHTQPRDMQIITNTLEKLHYWKFNGYKIVITTGRIKEEHELLKTALKELNVPFDYLITDLPPGPRTVINDKKPYNPLIGMANGKQIMRNQGIADIHLEQQPEILKIFDGGSFAKTYLIQIGDKQLVRKYIYKTKDNTVHFEQLKRQYEDLLRFNFYSPAIVPKVISQVETQDDYWFDLEYLEGYQQLSQFSQKIQLKVLQKLINNMKTNIYCYSKSINGREWLENYLNEKIYVKYSLISNYGLVFDNLINSTIIVNGKKYSGIKNTLKKISFDMYYPTKINPIHGDLTLQNIMYNVSTNDIKIIDMAGAKYMDIIESDLAKLLQSIISRYELWEAIDYVVKVISDSEFEINNMFLDFKNDLAYAICEIFGLDLQSGIFYLALYWIRMTPFMLHKKKEYAILGLILCNTYLNNCSIIN